MKITLNGNEATFDERTTVMDVINSKNINPENVAVELNLHILSKEEYATAVLRVGDTLEILSFMGGGR
ncbi:MAG: sulfur carrier protein ThiS [Chitinivibrionales bacterium]|nr:sulfur carrier protein ThiS [Chitinivibrionales bacterium]